MRPYISAAMVIAIRQSQSSSKNLRFIWAKLKSSGANSFDLQLTLSKGSRYHFGKSCLAFGNWKVNIDLADFLSSFIFPQTFQTLKFQSDLFKYKDDKVTYFLSPDTS